MPLKRNREENSEVLPVGDPPQAGDDDDLPLSPPEGAGSPPPRSPRERGDGPRPAEVISDLTDDDAEEEGYELAETAPLPKSPSPEPTPAPPSAAEGRVAEPQPPAVKKTGRTAAKPNPKPVKPRVTGLWNQRGDLGRLAIVPIVLVVLGILICTSPMNVLIGVFTSLAGLAMLAYLVAVSLDRPVRVTPEQGVREYFEALDHHLPNLRRMYLLLTDDAKQVPELSTYRRFRAYWIYRLALLRPAEEGMRPMVAKVRKFKSQYNRNRTWARASYILEFYVRGLEGESVATFEMNSELVKAADGMWYLNEGRIPEPGASH